MKQSSYLYILIVLTLKYKPFRESFALGLSLTVSGDTPISALDTLVLFICGFNEDMVSSLNALRCSIAFSNNDNLHVHF